MLFFLPVISLPDRLGILECYFSFFLSFWVVWLDWRNLSGHTDAKKQVWYRGTIDDRKSKTGFSRQLTFSLLSLSRLKRRMAVLLEIHLYRGNVQESFIHKVLAVLQAFRAFSSFHSLFTYPRFYLFIAILMFSIIKRLTYLFSFMTVELPVSWAKLSFPRMPTWKPLQLQIWKLNVINDAVFLLVLMWNILTQGICLKLFFHDNHNTYVEWRFEFDTTTDWTYYLTAS